MNKNVEIKNQSTSIKTNIEELIIINNKNEIELHSNGRDCFIELNEISHITQEKDCVVIYCLTINAFIDDRPLNNFEAKLVKHGFIKANFNTLVNTQNISCVLFGNNRSVVLTNNIEIKISRRRLYEFKILVNN